MLSLLIAQFDSQRSCAGGLALDKSVLRSRIKLRDSNAQLIKLACARRNQN